MRVGAELTGEACDLSVWAPLLEKVDVVFPDAGQSLPMERAEGGYWRLRVEGLPAGTLYRYRLDERVERPDPASHSQPQGVHGPSCIVDHRGFAWTDGDWRGISVDEMVLYELHVGTFTPEGTFDATQLRLDELRDLGVTAVELMPVAQFPGERNWGYDAACPFAVQASYGGPQGLKRFVDACHRARLAVVLDVVYNHLGPEGNYLADFGPYFTDRYRTPWGPAVNFDGPWSDGVRAFFIENALHWLERFHVDGLRLDAVHAIFDAGAKPFLEELAEAVEAFSRRTGRQRLLIAESDRNDPRLVWPRPAGAGLDALWCDDFHHCLHALLTGEREGYYEDFGESEQLGKALREGFVYAGEHSRYRKRRHGRSSRDVPPRRFVVFSQNHDQVGNRLFGERLASLVPFEALKLAAGATLLSPYVPLLFMGEEYGEEAPFLYFTSHADPGLAEAVREGRRGELRDFARDEEPPDPQDPETFRRSTLLWERRRTGRHAVLLALYQELLRLRRTVPALARPDKEGLEIQVHGRALAVRRRCEAGEALCLLNTGAEETGVRLPAASGPLRKLVDTADERWLGLGSPLPDGVEGAGGLVLASYCFAAFGSSS